MPFGPVRKPIQAQPLPPPHDDMEYLDQRFQAYYYTPHGVREVIAIEWNTRQHRAIFVDGNQHRFTMDVRREFQITLHEVLELNGIVIDEIELEDVRGQNIPDIDAMLNQSVEDMQLLSGTIWSQPAPAAPVEPALYRPEFEAAG